MLSDDIVAQFSAKNENTDNNQNQESQQPKPAQFDTFIAPPNDDENTEEGRRSNNISVSPNPIAVFRINEQENYEQNLFGAISATLDKEPKSRFTLVAVSSSAGNPSEQAERAANARNDVSRLISSLVSMGMPVDRISVSSLSVADVENTEVRLYAD